MECVKFVKFSKMSCKESSSHQNSEDKCISLPKTLYQLYPAANITSSTEALILAFHVVMLDAGFVPKNIPEGKKKEVLPDGWGNKSFVQIDYCHESCMDILCKVTYVPMMTAVAVHGTIANTKQKNISFPSDVHGYIQSSKGFSDADCVYLNFQNLSQVFLDTFVYSLLSEVQYEGGVQPSFGLAGLPIDLKFHLLTYLSVKSLVSLSAVNKEFNTAANSSFLWKKLFLRDFPKDVPAETDEQHKWKDVYKESYIRKKMLKKRPQAWPHLPSPYGYPGFGRISPHFPHIPSIHNPNSGLAPELQEAFPYLGRRFRTDNPLLQHIRIKNPWHPLFRYL